MEELTVTAAFAPVTAIVLTDSRTILQMQNCQWLKPELVAQIEFVEWTPDGHLRHSRFGGLREDNDARQVVRE